MKVYKIPDKVIEMVKIMYKDNRYTVVIYWYKMETNNTINDLDFADNITLLSSTKDQNFLFCFVFRFGRFSWLDKKI